MKKINLLIVISVFVLSGFFISQQNASGSEALVMHGFISQGYLESNRYDYLNVNTDSGSFEFSEMGLTFMATIDRKLHAGLQIYAENIGSSGNNELQLDWAYTDYHFQDWLGVRLGKVKVAFGLYNEVRDISSTRTCIFLPAGVYKSTDYRLLLVGMNGGVLYGELPYGVSYELQYGQLDDKKIKDFASATGGRVISDSSMENVQSFSFQWRPLAKGLVLGVSWWEINGLHTFRQDSSTSTSTNFNDLMQSVISAEYTYNDLLLVAEYNFGKINFDLDINLLQGRDLEDLNVSAHNYGYYGHLAYRLSSWLELGTTYSVLYNDKDNKENPFENIKDLIFSSQFDITDNWLMKLEIHEMNGLENIREFDLNSQTLVHNDSLLTKWYLYAIKTSYSF
jgi:hypothetical protein